MIRLVHLDRSRSERIIWLLEELGRPYELDAFRRRPDLFGPDEMRRAHVLGRAPVIFDGDIVLAESGAIVDWRLTGDAFTAADIMMAYPFTTFRRYVRPLDLSEYPSIAAYAVRLENRPAFRGDATDRLRQSSTRPGRCDPVTGRQLPLVDEAGANNATYSE